MRILTTIMDRANKPLQRILRVFFCINLLFLLYLSFSVHHHWNVLYERLHPASQITVYVTKYGEKYHADGCRYLRSSKREITLRQARKEGYVSCSRCNAPVYISDYPAIDTWHEYIISGYISEFIANHIFSLTIFFLNFVFILPSAIIFTEYSAKASPQLSFQNGNPDSEERVKQPATVPINYLDIARKEQFSPYSFVTCLWACTDLFSHNLKKELLLYERTYLWTTYFYIAAKTIRSQVIVDQIRSKLIEDSKVYFKDRFRGAEPYVIIQNSYRTLQPVLNASGINPQTSEGQLQLWDLFCKWVSASLKYSPTAKRSFLHYAIFVVYASQKYCENTQSLAKTPEPPISLDNLNTTNTKQ